MKMKKTFFLPPVKNSTVEIDGSKEALICGCKGIEHYSETDVKISVPEGSICVSGEKLIMRWAGAGKLLVCGKINSVTLGEVYNGKNL